MRRTYVRSRGAEAIGRAGRRSSLVAAACGDDDDDGGTADTRQSDETDRTGRDRRHRTETDGPGRRPTAPDGTEAPDGDRRHPPADAAMTITFDINPDAVWEDGSPITWADFECTWQAQLNTPGLDRDRRLRPDRPASPRATPTSRSSSASTRSTRRTRRIFDAIIKKAAVADCMDISADFQTRAPDLGPAVHDRLVRRERDRVRRRTRTGGATPPKADRILITGFADRRPSWRRIKSGEVDFIFPQFFHGIDDAAHRPERRSSPSSFGGDYEGCTSRWARTRRTVGAVRRRRVPPGVLEVDRP